MYGAAPLPAEAGAYVLLLLLAEPARLVVGRLGTFDFAAGWYAYVGSACGPGGLRGRLAHHLRPVERPHWHIDALRQVAEVREIWYATGDRALEHAWAAHLLALPQATVPAPRFGASDCRCPSHLVHLRQPLACEITLQFPNATRTRSLSNERSPSPAARPQGRIPSRR